MPAIILSVNDFKINLKKNPVEVSEIALSGEIVKNSNLTVSLNDQIQNMSVTGEIAESIAGIFAWWWLSEGFNAIQLIGCVTVFIGIYLADKARYAVGATK